MQSTIDRAGRLVIPKSIRERIGLVGEGAVEITEEDGVISIVPSTVSAHIVESGDGAVVRADDDVPTLTAEAVRQTADSLRR